ncbi:MAG: NAD-dependent epimerase/dehydratase family protein, partial [Candidatus Poribacteria bacterium]|nr:NAD-dependent epimerase/dehydratase family protein [Candidatus Poribacteria bacterium]
GAGFIGSHIVDLLLENNYQVRILDSLQKPVHLMGKPSYLPKDIEFVEAEVTDPRSMDSALQGIDVVFHQAAHQGFLPDFSTFFHVNSAGTALLFELIVKHKHPVQKVIVASSQAVHGEGVYQCPSCAQIFYPSSRPLDQLMNRDWEIKCPACGGHLDSLLTDEDQVHPYTQYAMSKYTQEMIALNLGQRHGIPAVALRYSITQGPRQSFFNAYSGILRIFCIRLMTDRPPILYEDGQMKRDYVHVHDVAKANLQVMTSEEANYQVYNVGSGIPVTQRQFADALAQKLGKSIEPSIPGEFRLGDVRHIVSDVSKLQSLGWQLTKSLDDILNDYIAWIESQGNVKDYFAEAERVMKKAGAVRVAKNVTDKE